jgi:polysaccharide deacetylase family sporulation protein PdaB
MPKITDPYWQDAKWTVDKSVLELLTQHEAELAKGTVYYKLIHGSLAKKQIAITFDDGPHPKYTPKLLRILKENNVKATFFLVGEMAEKYPELVKEEMAAGHSVGNHTYHHVNMTKIPEEYMAVELKACGNVLQHITGKAPHLFRPPGGDYDHDLAEVSEALGYVMVLWTDDPGDYASPGKNVIKTRIMETASNGGIILIHDGIQQTVDVLPDIIKYLRDQGYELVTIDQMINESKK